MLIEVKWIVAIATQFMILNPVNGLTCTEFRSEGNIKNKICGDSFGYEIRENKPALTIKHVRRDCIQRGGHLLSVINQAENEFIIQILSERDITKIFLGLEVYDEELLWFDDTTYSFENWSSPPVSGDCCFTMNKDGLWVSNNDCEASGKCSSILAIHICKFPFSTFPVETRRHFFSTEEKTWMEARDSCKLFRMNLVVVDDVWENMALNQLLINGNFDKVWIGLSDLAMEGKYQWVDQHFSPYRKWCPGEPERNPNIAFDKDCVSYRVDWGGLTGCLSVEKCDRGYHFVCERQLYGMKEVDKELLREMMIYLGRESLIGGSST